MSYLDSDEVGGIIRHSDYGNRKKKPSVSKKEILLGQCGRSLRHKAIAAYRERIRPQDVDNCASLPIVVKVSGTEIRATIGEFESLWQKLMKS